MMKLSLTTREASMLGKVLTSYLGDLRFEISSTDRMDFRESLKKEEVFLKRVLHELGEPRSA